jgi:hypothetical protein
MAANFAASAESRLALGAVVGSLSLGAELVMASGFQHCCDDAAARRRPGEAARAVAEDGFHSGIPVQPCLRLPE